MLLALSKLAPLLNKLKRQIEQPSPFLFWNPYEANSQTDSNSVLFPILDQSPFTYTLHFSPHHLRFIELSAFNFQLSDQMTQWLNYSMTLYCFELWTFSFEHIIDSKTRECYIARPDPHRLFHRDQRNKINEIDEIMISEDMTPNSSLLVWKQLANRIRTW